MEQFTLAIVSSFTLSNKTRNIPAHNGQQAPVTEIIFVSSELKQGESKMTGEVAFTCPSWWPTQDPKAIPPSWHPPLVGNARVGRLRTTAHQTRPLLISCSGPAQKLVLGLQCSVCTRELQEFRVLASHVIFQTTIARDEIVKSPATFNRVYHLFTPSGSSDLAVWICREPYVPSMDMVSRREEVLFVNCWVPGA